MADSDNVRASSERVVSSKVIGSSNPVARGFRKISSSITGVFGGCLMLIIALGLVVAAVKVVPDNSRKVEALDLLTPEEAKGKDELVKVEAVPDVSTAATLSYKTKNEFGQENPQTFDKDAIYLNAKFEIYEQKKEVSQETSTVTKDGQDSQETTEKTQITEGWVTKNEVEKFGTFKMGDIEVETKDIGTRFDTTEVTIDDVVMPDGAAAVVYENPSSQVGSTRLVVEYVSVSDELIVIGNLHNGKIKGGDVNIVSNYSDSELISKLKTEETAMRWGIRFLAWLFLTLGFTSVVGPILVFADFIPGVNKIVGCISFLVFGMLSALMVLLITFAINYWWLVILCILGTIGLLGVFLVYAIRKKLFGGKAKEESKEKQSKTDKEEEKK